MDSKELKKQAEKEIEKNTEKIIEIAENLFSHPELGYREIKTKKIIKEIFTEIGLQDIEELAYTGLKGKLKKNSSGPTIGILGEMDAVICHEHPDADLVTGAVHACGHHAQLAVMLGIAIVLKNSGIMKYLNGNVAFFAVPAEEFIDFEYRNKLKKAGKIKYYSGKQELISLGAFDDVDIVAMIHLVETPKNIKVYTNAKTTGFLAKSIKFKGKEAHAGAAPYEGVNALNAALLALNAINANRETFRDEDNVRVHSIFTKCGDAVNIVPADVRLEMHVRGNNLTALKNANKIVNRSLKAGAMAVGADLEVEEIPGYLPLIKNSELIDIFKENCKELIDEKYIGDTLDFPASFDFGDLMHIKPGLHPFFGGVKSGLHTKDFKVVDKEVAYILPVKAFVFTIIDLLANDAKKARNVIKNFKPVFSKEEYLKHLDESTANKVKFVGREA